MKSFFKLPLAARIYILAVFTLGSVAAFVSLSHFAMENTVRFAAYFSLVVLASALKVNLPTITGTMSVNSLFILICIVQLSEAETMLIGLAGVVIQYLWRPRSPVDPLRLAFSLTANALAIAASYFVFDRQLLANYPDGLRIVVTACTYFLANTALVALVVSLTESRRARAVWADCYFWCFPYYIGGAGIAWLCTLLDSRFDWQISFALLPVVYLVYRSYKLYLQRIEEEKIHVEEMSGLHLRTIEALALAIEAKDHTTHDHLRRVRVYALELGTRMGLNPLELQSLRAAALLHDIGKLAVPEHIISKPGKLTPDEFEKMKIHPVVGAQILEQVKFPYPVAPIVLCHHEKWDGSGYPNGLKGEEIPLGARILTAVDALDALASDRQYRRALPLDRAMEIVAADSGRTFDPAVIDLLRSCYVELERKAVQEPHSSVRLDTEPVILKGGAPATGFEQTEGLIPFVPSALDDSEPLVSAAQARQSIQELHEWTRSGDGALTLAETLAVFSVRLRGIVPHDAIAFYIRQDHLLIPAFVGGQNRKLFSSLRIPYGEGLSGWVAENKKPLLNGNPSVEAGYLNDQSKFSTLRSALAVPLETANGVVGVLALYRTERDAFSSIDLRNLVSVSSPVALSLEHAAECRVLAEETSTLTQLPNAGDLFLQIAKEAERASPADNFALVLCDLDGFSEINRRFGRQSGDAVLRAFGYGLRDFFSSGETVAHMGGDEFALLLPHVTPDDLERHLESLRLFASIAGRETPEPFQLSHSVGVALFPLDGADPETLLGEAETRLHRAKLSNRSPPKPSPTSGQPQGHYRHFTNRA